MKVLIRGGSIAAGHGVELGYVDLVHSFCQKRGVEMINRSAFRNTTFDGVLSFDEDIDAFRPELLLLHFGIDDAFFPVYRSEFRENLIRIVRRAKERFAPEIMLMTSHLLDNKYEMDALNGYYRDIREVCSALECEMIPVHIYWALYLQENSNSIYDLVQEDTRYPNEEGHTVYADVVTRCIERILPPPR